MAMLAATNMANAMRRRRSQSGVVDIAEPDPEEEELRAFEKNCRLLNTVQYRGWRRFQVEVWLLFEDQTSSRAAALVQGSIFMLIIFSTALILIQSLNECKWVYGPAAGLPYANLTECRLGDLETQAFAMSGGCERVCKRRLEPLEPGGPIHFFIMDAICIGVFTIEFLLRMVASPATIGFGAFCRDIKVRPRTSAQLFLRSHAPVHSGFTSFFSAY